MFQKPAFFQTGSIEKRQVFSVCFCFCLFSVLVSLFFLHSAVLLFGIGGGYDVFCGIPLLHELSNEGVPVVLANLSFAFDLDKKQNPKQETIGIEKTICIAAHHADHDENAFSGPDFPANYYPEFQLSQWLKKHKNFDTSVYTFNLRGERGPKLGIKNYAAALSAICDKHKVGHIVLVDAGVDSVCKGDEERVGTFSEDLMSFLAVRRLQGVKRYVMCVGLGTGLLLLFVNSSFSNLFLKSRTSANTISCKIGMTLRSWEGWLSSCLIIYFLKKKKKISWVCCVD